MTSPTDLKPETLTDADSPRRGRGNRLSPGAPGESRSGSPTGIIVKILCLGLIVAMAVVITPGLISSGQWFLFGVIWAIVVILLVVYGTKRFLPAKYLLPGTLALILFVIYPIIVTFQLSTTNFGDGTRTTKEESISRIIANSAVQADGAREFSLSVGQNADGYTFLLVDQATGDAYAGTPDGLTELDPDAITVDDDAITAADGYTILSRVQVNDLTQGDGPLVGFAVPSDNGVITAQGFSAVELQSPLSYDEASDTITNTDTGVAYSPVQAGDRQYFTSEAGERLSDISWGENVGFGNYIRAFTDPTIATDFISIFIWTLVFAVLSMVLTFALGLFLASTLNDSRIRGQKVFRSVLLLPYAIPGFIALLVWSSFFNREFGLFNTTTGLNIDWFGDPFWAKVAVIITNLWMGFPYMFLVCTGALQAIPSDLKEAASIDGATGWTNFRKITFPLLLVSVAPLLVATFAFNFNNFGAIFLLTEGGPFSPDNPSAGGTDILISYTYRLAFGGGAQEIGFASAISVILFILTGILAAIQFRATKKLEEY